MKSTRVRIGLGTILPALLIASTLGAQDGADTLEADECNPNAVSTQALARATFSMQRAFQIIQANQSILRLDSADRVDSLGNPLIIRSAVGDLQSAISALTGPPDKRDIGANDSLGRAYYLGQAYILLLEQPGVKPIGQRGEYGIATDTEFTIDLLAAADTQFTKVEQGLPLCREEIAKWRQQQPWLDALNGAINAINNDEIDTAEALAKRSLVIDQTTPYAYSILGNVAKQRKDYDNAIAMFNKAIEIADKSENPEFNDDRANAVYDIADVATTRAEGSSGPEKKRDVEAAIEAWNNFFPIGTRDAQVARGVQVIRNLLRSIDDTASLPKAYEKILEDPSHYGEAALLNAGLVATEAKEYEDAATLFSTVLEKNPNQRDALNNLAATYVNTKEYEKMLPLTDRLVSLDPNNENNWLLYAFAYTGLLQTTKEPASLVKSYTDSLVKYNSKAEQLPAQVSLTAFSHSPRETTLSGTITNKSKASKTYKLEVEFLDASGAVLGSRSVDVGPVAPDTSEPFTLTLPDQDAVAFRYKPLD